MSKKIKNDFLDNLFHSLMTDSEESPIRDVNRQTVYLTLGKLGYKHGVRKILGIYPTEKQAQDRARECQDSGDMDLMFRKYCVAKMLVGSKGSDIELEF
jgi:hypothetical protein